ncbi:MAG: AGE family epimerase/isomerase [Flavisolibacter sp.]|nr:AGE family epimerase/isomerase [Flavisolibacter sp.]
MNTHLHILEGFVNLYRVSPTELLEVQLHELIRLLTENIISKKTNHLVLFFDDEWNERSQVISYGHDIEAAWLVQEAAEIIKDKSLLSKVKERSLALTKAAAKGLDEDGGLWYEYNPEQHHLTKQKHSRLQAEAMIGFFNAWQNTGNETFLEQSLKSWEFVKKYMHDKTGGEWYWGVYDDYSPMNKEDKAGIWKCPYHNSRACIEIIKRTNSIIN